MELAEYRVLAHNIDPQAQNAIHGDEVAAQFGFSGALVPGVELFAYATSPLVAAWGRQWLAEGQIDLRFRRPVYDGEELVVTLIDSVLTVTGPDGEPRCVGSATQVRLEPALPTPDEAPGAEVLPAEPSLGTLGSFSGVVTPEDNNDYLNAIKEPLECYRTESLAHPGLLLRLVNLLLMRNVALGPWVHTSSDCQMLGLARLPAQLAVRGTVTDVYQRNGQDYVRYDAVVLADAQPVLAVKHTAIYRLSRHQPTPAQVSAGTHLAQDPTLSSREGLLAAPEGVEVMP